MKNQDLTKIIVTGASGFIGRNIIEYLCEDYYIFALARRTQQEVGAVAHENVEWIIIFILIISGSILFYWFEKKGL